MRKHTHFKQSNMHLDFMRTAKFCDPTGGFATMGIIMGIGMAGGIVSAVGSQQEGAATSRMYKAAAGNTDVEAEILRQTAATNVMLVKRNMEQNVQATQMDASLQARDLQNIITKVRGTQKATSAASGVGGGSVTEADIAQDTLNKEKMDEIAIRYNAEAESAALTSEARENEWRIQNDLQNQVWGLKVQKSQYLEAAKNAKKAANIQSLSTILSTASSVGSMGMQYKFPKAATTVKKPLWSPSPTK